MTQKEKSVSISPGDFFEIGLIVPNLEKAIEQFHDAFGYTFTLISGYLFQSLLGGGGTLVAENTACIRSLQ